MLDSPVRFSPGSGSELVGRADVDDDGIVVVFGRLDQPAHTGRKVPAARENEVRACADVEAERPAVEIVAADADLRIHIPPAGDGEEVLDVGVDVDRATVLEQGRDTRFHPPVVGDVVTSVSAQSEDGAVAARMGVDADPGAYRPPFTFRTLFPVFGPRNLLLGCGGT